MCIRDRSYECQLAVGAAVINRVKSGSYPNSSSGVIYQKGQLGPASSGKLARKLSGRISSSCYSAAQEAMSGVDKMCIRDRYMAAHGAMYPEYIKDGQYWRLFTSMFMHFGLMHICLLYTSDCRYCKLFLCEAVNYISGCCPDSRYSAYGSCVSYRRADRL